MIRTSIFLSLLAPLSALAFAAQFTPSSEHAEIDLRKVSIGLVHDCTVGEGYSGTATISCKHSGTVSLGADDDLKTEAVVDDVGGKVDNEPGDYDFDCSVDLTDLEGDVVSVSDTVSVRLCRWDSVTIEPYGPCKDTWNVGLNVSGPYDGTPTFVIGGVEVPRGVEPSIDYAAIRDTDTKSVDVTVRDDEWGGSKTATVNTDFSDGDPQCGSIEVKLGSIDISLPVYIGPGTHSRRVTSLRVRSDAWDDALLSRESLSVVSREVPQAGGFAVVALSARATAINTNDVSQIFDDGGLRQLQYPGGFTDITNYPSGGYGITGYAVVGDLQRDGSLCVAATNLTARFHYDFLRREPEEVMVGGVVATNKGLVITGWRAGGATNMWEYIYGADPDDGEGTADWQLVSGGLVRESRETTRLSPDRRSIRARTYQAQGGGAVSDIVVTERKFPWGWTKVAEVVDPDGAALSSTWTYATSGEGSYGRLVSHTDENNVTTTYEYDAAGRVAATTSPTPMGTRRVEYSYAPVDPRENSLSPALPNEARTTTESIAGVVVARTWKAIIEGDGTRTVVTERAASQSASYGAAGNLRDETVSYATSDSLGRLAGRPIRRLSHDGTLTAYSYGIGNLLRSNDTAPCDFAASPTGAFLRVSSLRTSASRPGGVPGESTISVSVFDSLDNEVYSETCVVTGPGTSERISWKHAEYDADNRPTRIASSDGSIEEYAYCEHGPVWHKDASGTVTTTEYDALGRVVSTTRVSAPQNYPFSILHSAFEYDAAGRVLTERKWAESSATNSQFSILHSAFGYDLAGREVFSSSPDGQETLTSYGRIPGTPFIYTETVTRPCAARAGDPSAYAVTNRSVRYKCGIAAWTEFNGERRTSHAYGLNQDGTQWSKTFTGPAGTSSPVWTKTTSDFLGGASGCGGSGSRAVSELRPAFGGGMAETRSEYDALGRLAATIDLHVPDGNSPFSILHSQFFSYDALGSRVLTIGDADGDGAFSLAGSDSATSNSTRYVKLDGDWWRESISYSFPITGSSEAVPLSRTRQRLTGLGAPGGAGVPPAANPGGAGVPPAAILVSETRSLAYPSTAETVTRTYRDRDSCASVTVTDIPGSELPALSFSVGGLVISNVTATGVATSYAYDALGRTLSVTDGRGNATAYAYDTYGNMVSSTLQPLNLSTLFTYDPLNRQISTTDPLGNTTYTAYDAENRVMATWGATYPVLYSYDAFGRLSTLSTTRDDEAANQLANNQLTNYPTIQLATGGAGAAWDTTRWNYDDATGLLTNKVYADGLGPSYTYTPDGRLATRTWARGVVTSYSYDFAGNLTNVMHNAECRMQNGSGVNPVNPVNPVETTYAYDRSGHMLSATVAGVSTNHYSYSVYGQLTNEVQNGAAIARAYDSLSRPTGYSLRASAPLREVNYSYDSLGRFGSVVFNAEPQSGGIDFTYTYLPGTDLVSGYTSGGFSRSVAYESGRDLISAITSAVNSSIPPLSIISTFAYANDAAGRRVEVSRSGPAFGALSGVTDAYGYDERSQVVSSRRTLGNEEVRGFDYDYAYDPIGNRLAASYYDEQGEEAYSDYEANALNQYTSRTVPCNVQVRGEADAGATVTVNGNPTWRNGEYFYGGDYADNSAAPVFREVEIAAVVPAQTPDGYDEIDAVTGRLFVAKSPDQFTYDADGNMTSDGRFSYVWNAENRLIRAQELYAPTNRAPYTVTYAYDHRGRMVSKRIYDSALFAPLREIKSTTYLWDDWNIIREIVREGGSATVTDNVWGLDLDGTLQGAGGVGGLLAVFRFNSSTPNSSTPQLYFPTYDANGNVSEYVTTNGDVVAHYDYSPFGETLVASGDLADSFTHRFSTKPWCPVTGQYEYQMRKYRPDIGRWMSRDPIGEETDAEITRYCFIQNSSLDAVDYLGFWGCTPPPPRQPPEKPSKKCCGDIEYDPTTQCCIEEEDDGSDEIVPGIGAEATDPQHSLTAGEANKTRFVVHSKAATGTKVYRWHWRGTFRGKHNVVHYWITWPGGSADSNGMDDGIVHVPAIRPYHAWEPGVTSIEEKLSPCDYDIPAFVSCVERKSKELDGKRYGMCYKFVDDIWSSCLRDARR